MKLDSEDLIMVSQILERDSKFTTYKFALLRATIDTIQLFDHLILHQPDEERVTIPTGLIVERWIWYYYPLLESGFFPQMHNESYEIAGGKNIAFRKTFTRLIKEWSGFGDFKQFYNDFKKMNLPANINLLLGELVNKLYYTITNMPMKHIGQYGSGELYSIYRVETRKGRWQKEKPVTTELLIREMGTFSIPYKFYLTLKYLGSFIEGMDSVLNKWADFVTVANKRYSVSKEIVLDRLYRVPESFRDVAEVSKYYRDIMKKQPLYCVWSGKRLHPEDLNVDHVLPFSRFPNNSFWNLLPSTRAVNYKKSDRIPEPDFLEKRQKHIFEYWDMLWDHFDQVFLEEVRLDLLPWQSVTLSSWQHPAIESLKGKAEDLIRIRGMEPWKI